MPLNGKSILVTLSSSHTSLLKPFSRPSSFNVRSLAKSPLSLSFQKGTQHGSRGTRMDGYGKGKEKKSVCVCGVGHSGGVTMRFTQSLLW